MGRDAGRVKLLGVAVLAVMLGLATQGPVTAPVGGSARAAASPAVDPPNVVVIMTDDQTLESLRVMPNVNTLIGDSGVRFSQFVVTYSLCCPSRATFLSGQYSHKSGVLANEPPNGGYAAFDHSNSLPVWLQAAGYRTIHLGKYLNGYPEQPPQVVPPGWDSWQAFYPLGYFNYGLNVDGVPITYGSDPADYSTDVLAARAVDAIATSAPGEPFFLNLALYAPHDDHGPPVPAPRHAGSFASEPLPNNPSINEADVSDKPSFVSSLPLLKPGAITSITASYRAQLETLQAADELVADVIDALQASGELANTVVMFTSDNGLHYGEHRISSSKGRPYEESIHVPLLVRGPGFPANTTVASLAANIDLAPTIAAIAGAVPMRPVDGVDLRSIIQDPGPFADRGVLLEGYVDKKFPCFNGVRTAEAAYWEFANGEEELYDLTNDPYQLQNRADNAAWAALQADMQARLAVLEPPTSPCIQSPPEVSVGDVAVAEPSSGPAAAVSVPVRIDTSFAASTSIPYTITLGTASSRDAVTGTGSVVFNPGVTTANISVKIKSDTLAEAPETVLVTLNPPADPPYSVPRPSGTVTILDRGAPTSPAVAVGDLTLVEGDTTGTGSLLVTVTISQPRSTATVVSFATAPGTAEAGGDFTTSSGSATIKANKTSVTFAVSVLRDVFEEPTEAFTVTITPPAGVGVDRPTGTVTILDDDHEA